MISNTLVLLDASFALQNELFFVTVQSVVLVQRGE